MFTPKEKLITLTSNIQISRKPSLGFTFLRSEKAKSVVKFSTTGFTLISLLLRCKRSCQGFTLIELLVAITIISIISLAGVIVYTNVQQGARDARRKEDIASIAAALETARNNEAGVYGNVPYSVLPASDFPKDPSGARYCFASNSEPLVPQSPSKWDNRSSCPSGYVFMPTPNSIGSNVQAWRVCSLLEKGSDLIFCRHNSQ